MSTTPNSTPLSPVPPPPAAPPSAPPPVVPPPQKNTLLWVLGGCGVAVVLVGILIIVSVRMFVKSHVKVGSNGDVDISLGGASLHAGQAKDLGLPIYPGAETMSGRGVEITAPGQQPGQQAGVSMAIYMSSDSIEKVDAWYREKLGKDYTREMGDEHHVTVGGKALPLENGAIAYVSGGENNMTMISLTTSEGKTQISMMRVGGTERKTQ